MLTYNDEAQQTTLAPETIGDVLATIHGADEWQVETLRDEEMQVYLIGDHVESRRSVSDDRARVTIYNDHTPRDLDTGIVARGRTETTLLASDVASHDRLAAKLHDAVARARLTDNPPFGLPGFPLGGFPMVETVDPALEGEMGPALESALAQLRVAAVKWSGVHLSSAELFARRSHRALRNSRGLTGFGLGTRVFLDFVLIAHENGKEAEFHAALSRRRLADFMTDGTVSAYATFARHSLFAAMPATHSGPVILTGQALADLFNPGLGSGPLTVHASGQAIYQKISRFKTGDFITPEQPRGDRITLTSDALRPWGVETAPFDAQGLPASRVSVIVDGVFVRPWSDARYAAYLGIEPTGSFANVTITPGHHSLEALRSTADGPVYEIVSFSWMNPDPVSGDFVAEIKLGYRHDADGTTPIKGGSLSGNVFAALTDARLSAEKYSDGTYYGPAGIRFGSLTIAGE